MKYCGICGSVRDANTDLCPICDKDKIENDTKSSGQKCHVCGGTIDNITGKCMTCDTQSALDEDYEEYPITADLSKSKSQFECTDLSADIDEDSAPTTVLSRPLEDNCNVIVNNNTAECEVCDSSDLDSSDEPTTVLSNMNPASGNNSNVNSHVGRPILFCSHCGAHLDKATGKCPACDNGANSKPDAYSPAYAKAGSNYRICRNCGRPIDINSGRCLYCSPAVPLRENITCPKCKTIFEKLSGRCPVCGYNIHIDEKPVRHKKNKVLTVILTVIMSILLFVTASSAITLMIFRNATSEESIDMMLEEVDYSDLIDEISGLGGYDKEKNLFDGIQKQMLEKYGIRMSRDDFVSFAEKAEINEFLADYLYDIIDVIKNRSGKVTITTEDVYEFLSNNKDVLCKEISPEINDEIIHEFSIWLVENETIKYSKISRINPTAMDIVSLALSDSTVVAMLIVCAIFIIFMCFNSVKQMFIGTGTVLLILSGVLGAAMIFTSKFITVFNTLIYGSIIELLITNGLSFSIDILLALAIAGIACIIARVVMGAVTAKK